MRILLSSFLFGACTAIAGCGENAMPTDSGPPVDTATAPVDTGTTTMVDAQMPPPSTFVDPMCTDGMYAETPPDRTTSLAGLAFTGDVPSFVDEALMRRYPFGLQLVRGGRMNPSFPQDCSEAFAGAPSSAMQVYSRMSTIVHECGHLDDLRQGGFGSSVYVIRTGLQFECSGGDTTMRGGVTFARSRIRNDAYQPLRPACSGGRGCDFYADVYLDGNPDDAMFEGGDQGFNSVLEETTQYVNSLVTDWAFQDQMGMFGATSARDGILTFLWYVERYLHMARTMFPAAYAHLSGTACWRDAILTVWGRAWLYLELTRGEASLGIDDEALLALVSDPVLLEEIERLRMASGCP
jgi:hypothetical protein